MNDPLFLEFLESLRNIQQSNETLINSLFVYSLARLIVCEPESPLGLHLYSTL